MYIVLMITTTMRMITMKKLFQCLLPLSSNNNEKIRYGDCVKNACQNSHSIVEPAVTFLLSAWLSVLLSPQLTSGRLSCLTDNGDIYNDKIHNFISGICQRTMKSRMASSKTKQHYWADKRKMTTWEKKSRWDEEEDHSLECCGGILFLVIEKIQIM